MHLRYHSDLLRLEAVKFFMDGVIESGTAYLLEDYADTPGQRGHPYYSLEQFIELGSLCDRLGDCKSVYMPSVMLPSARPWMDLKPSRG